MNREYASEIHYEGCGTKCAIQIAAIANWEDGDRMLQGQDVIAGPGVAIFLGHSFIHSIFIHDERLV